MKIAELTIDRYEEVLALFKRTPGVSVRDADSKESTVRYLLRNPGLCYVAEEDGRIIGSAMCGHDGRRGYLQPPMNEVLIGGIERRKIVVVDYDASWPDKFRQHAEILSVALGDNALAIEHVGSTSVPGLAAKPIIDIDILVADSGEESTYLPALVEAGYVLRVREPDWHQHRMFRTPELDVHVHIFSSGCVEVTRHLAFRDRLRKSVDDRLLYESVKRKLAKEEWSDMNAYAHAKTEVVELIIARALKEFGDMAKPRVGSHEIKI